MRYPCSLMWFSNVYKKWNLHGRDRKTCQLHACMQVVKKKYFCTAGIASKKMLLIHLQKGSMSQIWDWLCIATDGLHLAWYGGRGIYWWSDVHEMLGWMYGRGSDAQPSSYASKLSMSKIAFACLMCCWIRLEGRSWNQLGDLSEATLNAIEGGRRGSVYAVRVGVEYGG